LQYAAQLVALLRETFPEMGIGVAGYPETHPEASDAEADLRNLISKVSAGADAVFTQLFFDNASFFRFRDRLGALDVPVIPGIMPIVDFDQIVRITSLCGAKIPTDLASRLEDAKEDRARQFEVGVQFATDQCAELLSEGTPGIHFYVLNKSAACLRILENLGSAALLALG
jgi:methylenetetrahydrofolate reductase (NADPH)